MKTFLKIKLKSPNNTPVTNNLYFPFYILYSFLDDVRDKEEEIIKWINNKKQNYMTESSSITKSNNNTNIEIYNNYDYQRYFEEQTPSYESLILTKNNFTTLIKKWNLIKQENLYTIYITYNTDSGWFDLETNIKNLKNYQEIKTSIDYKPTLANKHKKL